MTFRKQYLDNIPATKEQSRTMQIEVDKYLCNDIRKCEKENEREENQMKDRSHAAALYVTPLYRLDLSHPLKLTRTKVQQKPKQVIATATFKNIITSRNVVKSDFPRRRKTRTISTTTHCSKSNFLGGEHKGQPTAC